MVVILHKTAPLSGLLYIQSRVEYATKTPAKTGMAAGQRDDEKKRSNEKYADA
jgi:hypothetical protein